MNGHRKLTGHGSLFNKICILMGFEPSVNDNLAQLVAEKQRVGYRLVGLGGIHKQVSKKRMEQRQGVKLVGEGIKITGWKRERTKEGWWTCWRHS